MILISSEHSTLLTPVCQENRGADVTPQISVALRNKSENADPYTHTADILEK